MTIIDSDPKLDFQNVLIRPKRSTLNSRSKVDLNRSVKFFNAKDASWKGVPVIAANMATTGTFEVYNVLKEQKMKLR